MKRMFDVICGVVSLLLLLPVFLVISILIKIDSRGPVLFKQRRIGQHNMMFVIYKFRTMKISTPDIATEQLNPSDYVTFIGDFLRKTSLDELPQLINIIRGEMSFVGPRPALYNQIELINYRSEKGIDAIRPGLTGWAQINGRNEICLFKKVEYDEYYLNNYSFLFDMKILVLTFYKVLTSQNIKV